MVRPRGRGSVRARGRGRGRGLSRRGRGSYGNTQGNKDIASNDDGLFSWSSGDESIDQKLRNLFLTKTTFQQHADAQNEDADRYLACLCVLLKNHVQIIESSKALSLAVFWARKDFKKSRYLLKLPNEMFSLKEVLRAVSMLDASRNKRAQEKMLKRLEVQKCKKKLKLSKLKSLIGSLEAETPPFGSLSGALIKQIKMWTRSIPAHRLEFFAMHFPTEPWKKLADLCHLHPEKDFPQSIWFLPFCYGKPLPESVGVSVTSDLKAENISSVIMTKDIDYTVVRNISTNLTKEAKERVASYTPLNTVLWYYEELECEEVDKVLEKRLKDGEKPTLPYGKLMDRILYCKSAWLRAAAANRDWDDNDENEHAEPEKVDENEKCFTKYLVEEADRQLKNIKFNLESPVSVIGDRSSSMNVAIRTSNIIASLITAVSNADLVFFDHDNYVPKFIPKNVSDVFKLCKVVYARGSTIPAASLLPYYVNKQIFKTFVIVTDEGENGTVETKVENGSEYDSFAKLFKKYYHEVYKARLIFISFIPQNSEGYMVKELKQVAPEIKVLQFCFDERRPDLSKLDNVFGLLSSSEKLSEEIDEFVEMIKQDNMEKTFEAMNLK